jgi:S1-C subfamily serine protease
MRFETGVADLPERNAVMWTLLRLPSVSTEAGGLRVHESGSAEIRAGDLIVEVAGLPVRDFDDLRRAARDLQPASRCAVAVMRDGQRLYLDAALGGNADEPLPTSRQVTLTLDPDPHAGPRALAIRNALLGPEH